MSQCLICGNDTILADGECPKCRYEKERNEKNTEPANYNSIETEGRWNLDLTDMLISSADKLPGELIWPAQNYLWEAELLYGKRSNQYPFNGSVDVSETAISFVKPHYNITGKMTVEQISNTIYLIKDCFKKGNEELRIFELTREIIHAFSGTHNEDISNLERGLAYSFCEICMKKLPDGLIYFEDRIRQNEGHYYAYNIVKAIIAYDENTIKNLRKLPRINGITSNIDEECFEEANVKMPKELIKYLTSRLIM